MNSFIKRKQKFLDKYGRWTVKHPNRDRLFPLLVPFAVLSASLRIRLFDDSVFKRNGLEKLLESEIGKMFKEHDETFPGVQLQFADIFPEGSLLRRYTDFLCKDARANEEKMKQAEQKLQEAMLLEPKLKEAEKKLKEVEKKLREVESQLVEAKSGQRPKMKLRQKRTAGTSKSSKWIGLGDSKQI